MTLLPENSLAAISAKVPEVRKRLMSEVERLLDDKHSDNPRYTDKHRDELIAQLHVEARRELDRLELEKKQAADRITTWMDSQPAAPHALHSEVAYAWNAIEWQLDKGITIETLLTHATGAASKGDMAPLRAIEERFETWARNGEHLSDGTLRDVVTKVHQAVANTTPGEAGMVARTRIQLDHESAQVTGALSQARGDVERLEANPEGTLRYARRLADVEAHSVGSSVVRGVRQEQEVETKPGADITAVTLSFDDD